MGLSVALAVGMVIAVLPGEDSDALSLSGRLNPNTATAPSLARLPGIGQARAAALLAYRARIHAQTGREPVFSGLEDLTQIRGIGSKTVEAIAPWLDFDASSHSTAQPNTPPTSSPTPAR